MSLDRKDLRLYLDAEVHEALAVLADIERTARIGISRKKPD